MAVSKETIEAIIDHLCDELDRGNHFFQIANALHKAHEKNQLHNAPYFFAGAYDACLRESILSLAKLTVLDKESITLSYLLDAAVQTPKMFQSITHDELKTAIAEHKKQIGGLRPLIERVKGQRDQVIAHLDRKHINSPGAILSNPVNMTEVGQYFETLLQMVNFYRSHCNGSEFSFALMRSWVQADINYLIAIMEGEQY